MCVWVTRRPTSQAVCGESSQPAARSRAHHGQHVVLLFNLLLPLLFFLLLLRLPAWSLPCAFLNFLLALFHLLRHYHHCNVIRFIPQINISMCVCVSSVTCCPLLLTRSVRTGWWAVTLTALSSDASSLHTGFGHEGRTLRYFRCPSAFCFCIFGLFRGTLWGFAFHRSAREQFSCVCTRGGT